MEESNIEMVGVPYIWDSGSDVQVIISLTKMIKLLVSCQNKILVKDSLSPSVQVKCTYIFCQKWQSLNP